METVIGGLEMLLHHLTELAIVLFELAGLLVIVLSGVRGMMNFLGKSTHTRLHLEEGLAMGLGFLLGGEILKTILVESLTEISMVFGIIVLRVALTVLIHWETKNEKAELAEKN